MTTVLCLLFPLTLLLIAPAAAATQPKPLDPEQELLRSELEPLRLGAALLLGEARIASGLVLLRLYERHNFSPLWTRHAMNVPVEARIDQIRVNLERLRWIYRELDDTFLVADIAGFHVYFVRDGRLAWDARAQVGSAFRETPVFRANMTYLEFNPTWTVPPGILRKDVLPAIQKDPGYLRAKRLRVLDRHGNEVDPARIDWAAASASNLPYLLRQDPGPDNALGRVKFMFPNKHLVYIHDTPSRRLFKKPQRAFSSGCIRVERPFELAELVLNRPEEWNQQRFDEILGTGKPQTVLLSEPVPVLMLYFTVEADAAGRVRFREDLYGRDQRVLAALNAGFVFSRPRTDSSSVYTTAEPRQIEARPA